MVDLKALDEVRVNALGKKGRITELLKTLGGLPIEERIEFGKKINCYAKVRSQEIPGVTGKFVLGIQNKAGQRLIEFCEEKALIIANTVFQQHKTLYMDITRWSTLKSD